MNGWWNERTFCCSESYWLAELPALTPPTPTSLPLSVPNDTHPLCRCLRGAFRREGNEICDLSAEQLEAHCDLVAHIVICVGEWGITVLMHIHCGMTGGDCHRTWAHPVTGLLRTTPTEGEKVMAADQT